MGNENSDLSNATFGHHVLEVLESSVAEEYGIEVFFDYITHINGIYIGQESQVLLDVLRANIGKKISLSIYSSKYCESRGNLI